MPRTQILKPKKVVPVFAWVGEDPIHEYVRGLGAKKVVGVVVQVKSGYYAYDRTKEGCIAKLCIDLASAKSWTEEQCNPRK